MIATALDLLPLSVVVATHPPTATTIVAGHLNHVDIVPVAMTTVVVHHHPAMTTMSVTLATAHHLLVPLADPQSTNPIPQLVLAMAVSLIHMVLRLLVEAAMRILTLRMGMDVPERGRRLELMVAMMSVLRQDIGEYSFPDLAGASCRRRLDY